MMNLVFAAVAGVALLPPPVPGDDDDVTILAPVEVSDRRPALDTWPPALSTEITAEELEAINAPDIAAALKYEPNMNVRSRFIGDRNALLAFRDMHSFQSPRALVLGDGLLLSNFLGAGWDNAPRWSVMQPEEVERIEVIYGPYSAEYSGNSLGGVVILHGGMPDEFQQQASVGVFVQQFDAFGTDDSYPGHSLHLSLGDRNGRWSYLLAANRLASSSQPMEFNVTAAPVSASGIPVTGARTHHDGFLYGSSGTADAVEDLFKFKLGFDFTPDLQGRVTLSHARRSDEQLHPETWLRDANGAPVYDGTVEIGEESYAVFGQRLSLSEARELVHGIELDGALGKGWEIDAVASFYDILDQRDRASGNDHDLALAGGPGSLGEDLGSGWQALDLKLGHRHESEWLGERVLFGVHFDEYVLDHADHSTADWREATVTGLLARSTGKTRTQAVFVENEWQLAKPLTLVLGARQEWWKAYDGSLARDFDATRAQADYPERSESALSPKATLSYAPAAEWDVALSVGVAHRFPTVGELFQGALDNQGNFSAGFDPDLEAESGLATNLMFRRGFDAANLTLNLWQSDVEDTIFRQTDVHTGVWSFQNIERVRSRGVELLGALYDIGADGLTLDFNVSYTDARVLENPAVPASQGKQFPRVPAWRANAFADYRVNDILRVSGGVRYASDPYDTLDNSDGAAHGFGYTDGFLVFDARAIAALGSGLTLSGGIDNITDERYYVYHPYPGRTFFIELAWKH